ncbi:MAG TPA: hypothetical protein VEY70_15865 [Metabacillus sp.]|nr:hypothetical protein [Metabacillus sp.]
MVKVKKISIGLLMFVVCALLVLFLLRQNDNTYRAESHYRDEIELKFANNFISYIIKDKEVMSFNIFGVQNIENNDSSLTNLISSVEFNNPNINIVDYQVDTGIVYEGYKLVNIIVSAEVLTNNVEKADQLLIQFNNEDVKAFDIGNIIVQNDILYQNQHLEPKGNYTAGYPSLSLDVNIKNKTANKISPSKIYDLTENISYQFDKSFEFQPNGGRHIQINNFTMKSKETPDFMTITPILLYTLEGESYLYNMPGVIYGILDSDTDKIKKMIE